MAMIRQNNALELRASGATYTQIAEALNYATSAGAYQAVMSALDRQAVEPAEHVRKLELRRLDKMLLGLFKSGAMEGNTFKVMAALKIMERRAKYLGLDRVETVQFVGPAPWLDDEEDEKPGAAVIPINR